MSKVSSLKKPTLTRDAVLKFAEGAAKPAPAGKAKARAELAPVGMKSGLVPAGDVRLSANIRADLHTRLRIRAVEERTTVGELIEAWIASWPR